MSKEVLKMALEALEWCIEQGGGPKCEHEASVCFCKENNAITALREALAEQPAQQEPVAWYVERQHIGFRDHGLKLGPFWELSEAEEWTDCVHILKPLYTSPPAQRTWVGLTDEETGHWSADFLAGAKWADAKLKEKNT